MRLCGRALVAVASLLVAVGVVAVASAALPAAKISGRYTFTYRATNDPSIPPGVLDVRVLRPCAAPCKAFMTAERAPGESEDRGKPRQWKWAGKQYVFGPVTRAGNSGCIGRGKKQVKAGYDVTSKLSIVPGKVTNGRIANFRGSGRDDYVPNAKGRKAGCVAGAYVYVITAVGA